MTADSLIAMNLNETLKTFTYHRVIWSHRRATQLVDERIPNVAERVIKAQVISIFLQFSSTLLTAEASSRVQREAEKFAIKKNSKQFDYLSIIIIIIPTYMCEPQTRRVGALLRLMNML